MIVAAWGRSGGTKFCMDLSEKTGLPFIGEMHPGCITELGAMRANGKKKNHETNHDQEYNVSQHIQYAKDPDSVIILANDMHWSILPRADYFLFRKNIRNSMLSLGNLAIKSINHFNLDRSPTSVFEAVIYECRAMFMANYVSIHYALQNKINLTWYEDYFNNKPTLTPHLNEFQLKDQYIRHCDSLINQYNVEDLLQQLQTKYPGAK